MDIPIWLVVSTNPSEKSVMMTFPTEWTNKCSKPPTRHSVGSKYINISAGPETKQVKHPFPLEESDVSMYIYIYIYGY